MSNTSKTTINLDKNMKKELKKIAIDEDTSLSALILKMIEEAMENRYNDWVKQNYFQNANWFKKSG